jgi:GNAT superfamily N-acetyltransferase
VRPEEVVDLAAVVHPVADRAVVDLQVEQAVPRRSDGHERADDHRQGDQDQHLPTGAGAPRRRRLPHLSPSVSPTLPVMALGFVRPARSADAGDIARIQLATWRTAYRRMLPRQVIDQLDEAWVAQRWTEAIEAPPSARHRVLVAVEQAAQSYLVGFAATGPADEQALAPDEDPAVLGDGVAAVTDLLVEPRWGRRGHGSRLLAATVDLWREDGFGTAVAWAYERDAATRKFLTAAGWEPDGATRALDVDDLLVPQVRLHVAL